MRGPFSAHRRLELLNGVLALAEDRDGVTVTEAAQFLDTTETRVRECVAPLTDLELVEGSSVLGDLGRLVQLSGDDIIVRKNWWRDLGGTFSPSEAARLYVLIVTASELLGDRKTVDLGKLKRRLQGQIGVLVHEPIPADVRVLLAAAADHHLVSATLQSGTRSVPPASRLWEVHRVFQVEGAWKATLCPSDSAHVRETQDVYVDNILRLEPTNVTFDPIREYGTAPSRTTHIRVTVDHTQEVAWRLELFGPEVLGREGSRIRTRITVSGLPALRTLLLRLGPEGRVVEPEEYIGLQKEIAQEVLARYGS